MPREHGPRPCRTGTTPAAVHRPRVLRYAGPPLQGHVRVATRGRLQSRRAHSGGRTDRRRSRGRRARRVEAARRHLVRLERRDRRQRRAIIAAGGRTDHPGDDRPLAGRLRSVLSRLRQRHVMAGAALPDWPAPFRLVRIRRLPPGQCVVRRLAFAHHPAGRSDLGARLSSADACRIAARGRQHAAHRLVPAHPLPCPCGVHDHPGAYRVDSRHVRVRSAGLSDGDRPHRLHRLRAAPRRWFAAWRRCAARVRSCGEDGGLSDRRACR